MVTDPRFVSPSFRGGGGLSARRSAKFVENFIFSHLTVNIAFFPKYFRKMQYILLKYCKIDRFRGYFAIFLIFFIFWGREICRIVDFIA